MVVINNQTEKKLNPSQKMAVEHEQGPLLIVAGAGTGKTTVITERIKYLIAEKKVKPSEILALTFTEKAAQEMLTRLDVVMPLGYEEPWLMTFHSFGDQILREEGLEIGLSTDYKILDQANQWILLRKHLFDLGLNYYLPLGNPTKFIGALVKFFSRLQDEDITSEEFMSWMRKKSKIKNQKSKLELETQNEIKTADDQERLLELANAYKKYQEIKIKENFLDFGDLITWSLKLFRQRPAILKKYQNQFKHILVDEFQDTNWAQLQLIKLLAPPQNKPNLVVVGDDDQSIYKWRGAAVSNILDFKQHYPQTKEVILTANYRSGQKLLDSAYKMIVNNNPDRLEEKLKINKKLKAIRGDHLPFPKIYQLPTLEEEADFVINKIFELSAKENYTYKDFAILGRANNHLDPFLAALKRVGIPYQLVGNRGLFDQPEVRELIYFAKAVVDPNDSANLFQLLQVEVFGIAPPDLLTYLHQARAVRISLWELIEKKAGEDTKLAFVVKQIKEAQLKVVKNPASKVLYDFVWESGFIKKFLEEESVENQLKLKNLNLFFEKIKIFERENTLNSLVEFIDWLEILIESGENPAQAEIEDIDTVSLMTVHSAKGLEFPVVFVVNCVSDRFPTRKRGDPIEFPEALVKESLPLGDAHLQEERRLFYVACTRARDWLFLTLGINYGGARPKKPSPFLGELGLRINLVKPAAQQLSWFLTRKPIVPKKIKVIKGRIELSYISFSQIDTFLTCPLKYKYRYILQIPTRPHHVFTFGQTIHTTLHNFHLLEGKNQFLSLENLLALYEKHFDASGYESEEHKKQRFAEGKKYLKKYFESHKEKFPGKPWHLEKKFILKIGTLPLIGKIDRIDRLEEGYELIDYKTGKAKEQADVDKDRQLSIYAMAAKWCLNLEVKQLSLYFIEENKKITTFRSQEQLIEEKESILKTIEEIKKSDFSAKPNYPFPCQYCEYNFICPFAKKH